MPISPVRVFRVFVSSTFSDLTGERNLLQKSVFPLLRDFCARRGARFQPVDLRWGVSTEAAQEQRTMAICLEEIKRCQQTTPRPNFMIILGDRYGWRPLPSVIAVADVERMRSSKLFLEKLQTFQRLYPDIDQNAVPPVYCLRPQTADIDIGWSRMEGDVLNVLQQAAAEVGLPERERVKYGGSATEQEIFHGLLDDELVPHARGEVHAFLRNICKLPADPRIKDFQDWTPGGLDTDAVERQRALKQRLRSVLGPGAHDYDLSWPFPQTGEAAGAAPALVAGIGEVVYDALSSAIEAETGGIQPSDPREQERRELGEHLDFAAERGRIFIGRAAVLDRVASYLNSPDPKAFALLGPSGSGKSAAMARALAGAQGEHAQAAIVARFIGLTPLSSAGMTLLAGLTRQIAELYGAPEPTAYPDYPGMAGEFRKCLQLARPDRPLVVFLDALDQLPRSDYARSLSWLPPDKLPEHVRLVVSASTDSGALAATLAKFLDPYRAYLDPMPTAEAGSVLDLWLEDAARTLQPDQRESLLRSFRDSGLPLHLRLAFEQARLYRSFDPVQAPGSDVVQTIRQILAWLSSQGNHGDSLVRRSLSFLTVAKDGLNEEELTDVLSVDNSVMSDFRNRFPNSPHADQLPMIIWSRLYYDLKPYLTERDAQGTPVLNYFHRQFREAITAAYLPAGEKQRRHRALATYFQAKPNFHGENGGRAFDGRKLSELPYQERKAGMWNELEATLSDLAFVEAKCGAGLIYDLLADYDAALLKSGLVEAQKSRVASFGQFVRAQAHLLSTHPHLTLQQALNEPDFSAPAQAAAKAARKDPRPRFRLINKAQEASPCVMTLYGHTSYVNSCDISPDQTRIASASSDMEIKIWDAASGKELQTLRGHTGPVEGCSFDPDGLRVISGARNGEVKLWDAASGDVLWSGAHHEPVPTCRFSPKGERVVSASWDGTLKVWDAGTGAELLTIPAHQGPVYSCEFSPDGARIASAGGDGTLKLWDAATGREIRSVAAHKLAIMCCRFADKGAHLFTASQDMTLKRWDAATLQELNSYAGPEAFTWAAAGSPNGDRLVSGSADGSIRLFDVESGETLGVIQEHTNEVWELAYFSDGARFVSASWDGTLKIWDAGALERRQKSAETPHAGESQLWGYLITCCCSPDGTRYAAGSSDGSIRIWDAVTGTMIGTFPLHNDFVFCCAFSPDSRWLVSGAWNGRLKIFDTREQRVSDEASDPKQKIITFCAFTRGGKRVIACSEDAIRIWSFVDGKLSEEATWSAGEDEKEYFAGCAVMPGGDSIIALRNDRFEIWDIATRTTVGSILGQPGVQVFTLHAKRQTLAAVSGDGSVRLWNVATRALAWESGQGGPQAVSINFSPDGNRLVLGLRDHTASVWDLEAAAAPMVLTGHTDELQDAGFSHDGKRILSASVDGTLRLWDAPSGACLGTLLWPADSVSTCAWAANASNVVTASHRHCVKVWNGADGHLERILAGHTGPVLDCKFSPYGSLLSASADGTLRLWDPARGELLSWHGHNGPVRACDFSSGGNWIVSAGHDRSLRLWDARTGAPLGALEGHEDWVTLVHVAAEGRLILSGSLDKTVKIWDSASRQLLHTLQAHQAPVSALATNPDSSRMVTGDEKGALHIWSVASGSPEGTLLGHTGPIRACAWPGAIVSASQDGTLRLWDGETATTRAELKHEGPVNVCVVSPDGRFVASGSDDQFVKVWELATGRRLGEYWAGAGVRSLSWGRDGRYLAAGAATGKLHLLDWEAGSPSDISR